MRKTQLVENEYYHIYNRGVDKRNVFLDDFDYIRFLKSIQEFNSVAPIGSLYEKTFRDKLETKPPIGGLVSKRIVEIFAYCLNPNHYHFILKQIEEKGIEKFMHKLGSRYTTYFNQKYERTGSLFQGPFKAAKINPNNFLYLSAHVNCNAEVHGIAKAENYRWCSFQDYIGKRNGKLCSKEIILDQFKNQKDYFDFAKENAVAMKEKKEFEKLLFEWNGFRD